MWRNLWKSRGNFVDRAVKHGAVRVRGVWKTFFAWVFQGILILSTEILRLRRSLSVFLSRRKKNSEKERPLRGLRRGVRFIMSPPGKRRHNELNAAPPPETPRRTGKPGEASDRGGVQSGESFCVRGKTWLPGEPRGTTPTLASPQRGSQGLRDQITQTIYLYHTNRKKPSFSFAPSERYLRSTPAARLSASVIPLP